MEQYTMTKTKTTETDVPIMIRLFSEYVQLMTDADEKYAQFGFLQILGHCIGYDSYVDILPFPEHLNTFVMYVGDSFASRKSIMQSVIESFIPQEYILPKDITPEAYLENLSKIPNGFLFYGEFSKILKHINRNHYLSAFAETLNDIYTYYSDTYRRKIRSEEKEIVIEHPYPFLLTTLTHDALEKYTDSEVMSGGLFGRIIIVPGKTKEIKELKPMTIEIRLLKMLFEAMFDAIRDISKKYNFIFTLSKEASKYILGREREILNDNVNTAIVGRYTHMAIRISALISFSNEIFGVIFGKNSAEKNGSCKEKNVKFGKISNFRIYNMYNYIVEKQSPKLPNFSDINKIKEYFYSYIYNKLNDYFSDRIFTEKLPNFTENYKIRLLIGRDEIESALKLLQPSIDYLTNLVDMSTMRYPYIAKVRDYLKNKAPIERSKISRNLNLDASQMNIVETTLIDQDYMHIIRISRKKSDGTPAKPKTIYCLEEYTNSDRCKTCKYRKFCLGGTENDN